MSITCVSRVHSIRTRCILYYIIWLWAWTMDNSIQWTLYLWRYLQSMLFTWVVNLMRRSRHCYPRTVRSDCLDPNNFISFLNYFLPFRAGDAWLSRRTITAVRRRQNNHLVGQLRDPSAHLSLQPPIPPYIPSSIREDACTPSNIFCAARHASLCLPPPSDLRLSHQQDHRTQSDYAPFLRNTLHHNPRLQKLHSLSGISMWVQTKSKARRATVGIRWILDLCATTSALV